jgi:hypothetical protein
MEDLPRNMTHCATSADHSGGVYLGAFGEQVNCRQVASEYVAVLNAHYLPLLCIKDASLGLKVRLQQRRGGDAHCLELYRARVVSRVSRSGRFTRLPFSVTIVTADASSSVGFTGRGFLKPSSIPRSRPSTLFNVNRLTRNFEQGGRDIRPVRGRRQKSRHRGNRTGLVYETCGFVERVGEGELGL